LSRAMV